MKIILIKEADEVAHCVFSPTPLHMQTLLVVLLGDNSNYYCCLQLLRVFKPYKGKVYNQMLFTAGKHSERNRNIKQVS